MRLRNIRGSEEIIAASPYVIQNPKEQKGKWSSVFQNEQPIHIEVGMGKGRFILEMARQHPEINYIGIEKYTSVILRAVQKREEPDCPKLPNLFFLCMAAEELPEVFAQEEIDRIYLNFSDPWPKKRYAKRRLTSRQFLARYEQILKKEGHLEFKTDNKTLFEFSLEEVEEAGWTLMERTFDLHNSPSLCEGNVMTEYEAKFSEMGHPICKMMIKKNGN